MRFFFLLVFLAGVALAVAYPRLLPGAAERQIGSWQVYDPESGFRTVDVPVSSETGPVWLRIDLTVPSKLGPSDADALLTITASAAGRTLLARALDFAESQPTADSPQQLSWTYRTNAGTIDGFSGGKLQLVVGRGDAEAVQIEAVEVTVLAGGSSSDLRLEPIGYVLTALGFIGLVLGFVRGRRTAKRDNDDGSGPRWGRRTG